MKHAFLVVPALLLMTGCETVSWLRPIYTPGEIAEEPALAGVWRDADDERVTITREGDGYRFTVEDAKGEKTVLSGYLVRFGGDLYGDLSEKGPGIPDHLLVRIEIYGDRMTWFTLRSEWLRARVKDGTLRAVHFAEGKKDTRWVVNVEPGEAQRMLWMHRYDAWEESLKLSRVE